MLYFSSELEKSSGRNIKTSFLKRLKRVTHQHINILTFLLHSFDISLKTYICIQTLTGEQSGNRHRNYQKAKVISKLVVSSEASNSRGVDIMKKNT